MRFSRACNRVDPCRFLLESPSGHITTNATPTVSSAKSYGTPEPLAQGSLILFAQSLREPEITDAKRRAILAQSTHSLGWYTVGNSSMYLECEFYVGTNQVQLTYDFFHDALDAPITRVLSSFDTMRKSLFCLLGTTVASTAETSLVLSSPLRHVSIAVVTNLTSSPP